MGLVDKFINMCTEPVTEKKKKGILDRLYEACTEPVESKKSEEEISEEDSINFADSKSAEQIFESIKGQLQTRKRELRTIGKSLASIDIEKFETSKKSLIQEIINDFSELCDNLKELIKKQEVVDQKHPTDSKTMTDIMNSVNLEDGYRRFDTKYQQKISLINSLYWLNELKKQNKNMESDFKTIPVEDLSDREIENYRRYIQTISEQKEDFSYRLGDELIDELIVSEYRLRMLVMMKDINEEKEIHTNPFEKENDAKKSKYEELLLEDLEYATEQYNQIVNGRKKYIKSNILTEKELKELEILAQEVQKDVDLAAVDDLSISEMFTSENLHTLKKFIKLKAIMNHTLSEVEKIEDEKESLYYIKIQRESRETFEVANGREIKTWNGLFSRHSDDDKDID